MTFPSPPWQLQGQAWVSLFRAAEPGRAKAAYVAAWVDYEAGGMLAYRELLVARRVDRTRLTVTHIWVDSPTSREGARALWALPKELADFTHEASGLGLVAKAEWSATAGDRPVATASFADTSRVAIRLPTRLSLRQPRAAGQVETSVSGSGRSLPCLGHWEFDADGPLGWMAGQQPLVSFRVRDFQVTLG